MEPNVGTADRIIRILIAMVVALGGYAVDGTWGLVLYAVAAIAFVSALLGRCGVYQVLGIRTCPREEPDAPTPGSGEKMVIFKSLGLP